MNLFCEYINTPAAGDCLCRLPLPPPAPARISPCFYFTSTEARAVTFRDALLLCARDLMERSEVSYKVSPRRADTCFGLHEGYGVSAGRFVSDVALMRSKHKPSASLRLNKRASRNARAHHNGLISSLPLPPGPY